MHGASGFGRQLGGSAFAVQWTRDSRSSSRISVALVPQATLCPLTPMVASWTVDLPCPCCQRQPCSCLACDRCDRQSHAGVSWGFQRFGLHCSPVRASSASFPSRSRWLQCCRMLGALKNSRCRLCECRLVLFQRDKLDHIAQESHLSSVLVCQCRTNM